ncbi:type II and III secretion system protein family protein [Acidisphaera rubrifaciens]|uniref:Secretion system type II/III protein n=1 Tax=Acidisphaera rubrifaciens HS-AP3 TaxID=1231350 RepID=A0A0D6P5M3_9PROT|nr:pilus assembly protein N-terminal domain-containing protein [Acidisphaera rubrifaciens]GAN76967.1 secretion system type II/III protein [Acidisphaera rubrifaciens HS-AP3]
MIRRIKLVVVPALLLVLGGAPAWAGPPAGTTTVTAVPGPVAAAALAPLTVDPDPRAVVTSGSNGPPITLTKGALRALDFNDRVTRIIVTDGAVIDASVLSEREVRLVALKTGRTAVTVTTAAGAAVTYTVAVVPEMARVQSLLAQDPSLRGLHLASDDDRIIVTGQVGSVQAHAHAIDILHAFYGDQIVDLIQTAGGQMIAVEIRFAAVQADTLKELGFNLSSFGQGFSFATSGPSSLGGYGFARSGLSVGGTLPLADAFNLLLASPASNLVSVISALSDANIASVLAEPTLMVRSGDQADFIAGGEVPIPVPQGGSAAGAVTIEYHQYGVRLRIAPSLLGSGRIAMTVSPEVSEIDTANQLSISGYAVPAFRKRSTSTTIELNDGQSFVLAGLIYSSVNIDDARIPGLGDLPIIGNFFRYARNARERQELIIIATPHVVQALPPGPLPPLPGEAFQHGYDPGVADMALDRKPGSAAIAAYGLMR